MKNETDLPLEILLANARRLARIAGERIMEVYGHADFGITQKDDRSPLTEADLAAHRSISEGLRECCPQLPVLSEESVDIPWEVRAAWKTFWLVDPLDGTREFIKRNGEFTVNIALIDDHEPVIGVVHAPGTPASRNYVPSVVPLRYDGILFIRDTRALDRLEAE